MPRPLRPLLAAAGGVLAGLAFAPFDLFWCLPLAVACLTLATADVRLRSGLVYGLLFGLAWMGVLLFWVRAIAWPLWPLLAAAEAAFIGLLGVALTLAWRLPGRVVWQACCWIAVESLRSEVPFGGFPWGRLGHATLDTPYASLVPFVGLAGTGFAVALSGTALGALVAAARTRRGSVRGRSPAVALAAVLLALVIAPRPDPNGPNPLPAINVAAVQGNTPGLGLDAMAERRAVLDNHVRATLPLADDIAAGRAPRPDLLVWPENASDIDPYRDQAAYDAISGAVAAVGAPALTGVVVDRGDAPGEGAAEGWRNRALSWTATGEISGYYDKRHPVPFGEVIPLRRWLAPLIPLLDQIPSDMIPGSRPGALQVGQTTLGILMCFEVADSSLLYDAVGAGAEVVAVPTNNATYQGTTQLAQQFAISRLAAIEAGRPVVVAATTGITAVIAADGSVVRRLPERTTGVAQTTIRPASGMTWAMRWGRWPEVGLASAALASVLAGLVARRRARRTAGRSPSES